MALETHDLPAAARGARPTGGTRPRTAAKVSSVVVTLGVVSLLTDVSSEAVSAVLPLYITAALGMTTLAFGFVNGLMQGATAIVRVLGGWAADRGDHPKWVATVGYGLSMVTRVILFLVSGFAGIATAVTLDRVGKGIRTAPRDAMITASSDPRTIGRSFGVHRTLDTIGAAVGPLLAFVVLWWLPQGYSTVFVVSFGFAVVGFAVLVLLVPDVRPRNLGWLLKHRTRVERGLPKCKGCTCDLPGGLEAAGRPFRWSMVAAPELRRVMIAAAVLSLLTVGDGFVYLSLQARDGFVQGAPSALRTHAGARRLRDAVVPPAVRRHQRRIHGAGHAGGTPRRPGGPGTRLRRRPPRARRRLRRGRTARRHGLYVRLARAAGRVLRGH